VNEPESGAAAADRSALWQAVFWAAASIALLLLVWQLAALIADDPRRLPTPFQVIARIIEETAKGDLPYHLGVTLARVIASFIVAMVIGTALGFAMGRLPLLDQIGHAWLVFFLNMPALVIIVLCYIWIGLVETAVVVAVALNNLFCILAFEVAHTVARTTILGEAGGVAAVILPPLRQLAFSALLGGGIGLALVAATRRVVRPDRLAAASITAILLTMGLAQHFDISVLLSCLFLGVLLANATPDKEEIGHDVLANFEYAIFAMFFWQFHQKSQLQERLNVCQAQLDSPSQAFDRAQ